MQYEVSTPVEYLAALDNDWRKDKLLELREIIQNKAPDLKEGIQYKMLCYTDKDEPVFHLNAQMAYVSFYVGNASKVDPEGRLLEGIDAGKGCLRFKKSTVISNTRIDEFIALAVEKWYKGQDIGC